jgi:O-antigen ligase
MRYLLALLIFFLATADVFGWTASLAPGVSVKNAILYLIILALATRFVVRGGMHLELPQVHLWFGVLIAYATLSWLVTGLLVRYESYTLLESGIDLKAYLLDNVLVFVLFLYGTRTLADARFLLRCLLLAVAAANVIAIGNVAGLYHIGVTTVGTEGNLAGRVFGAFGHANETGALIVSLLPAYLAAALSATGGARVLWVLPGVASAALMIMTGSRGAFVALLLGVVFGSVICRRIISWRRALLLAVAIVALMVPLLAFISLKFGDVFTQRVTEMLLSTGTSSVERTYIWQPVIDRMLSNPIAMITGFGWATYDVMGFFFAAHNYYLLLWFELGIVGLVSYLLLIRSLLISARRAAEHAPDETARYLIAFVYGMVGLSAALVFSVIYKPWLYVWMYTGVTMRMALLAAQTAQRNAALDERTAHAPAVAPGKRVASQSARTSAAAELPVFSRRKNPGWKE